MSMKESDLSVVDVLKVNLAKDAIARHARGLETALVVQEIDRGLKGTSLSRAEEAVERLGVDGHYRAMVEKMGGRRERP